jgi:hypothetical protein
MRSLLGRAGEPVPCIRCDRREVGLAWGDYCEVCREERNGRANRAARRAALLGAALIGIFLLRQGLVDFKARLFAGASVLLVYVILRRLVSRGMLEYLLRQDQNAVRNRPS